VRLSALMQAITRTSGIINLSGYVTIYAHGKYNGCSLHKKWIFLNRAQRRYR